MENAVAFYKEVLHYDNMHVEAIACIGTNYFYTDQPEVALKFYRCVVYTLIFQDNEKSIDDISKRAI